MKTEFNFESIPFSAKYYGTRNIDGWEDAGATSTCSLPKKSWNL